MCKELHSGNFCLFVLSLFSQYETGEQFPLVYLPLTVIESVVSRGNGFVKFVRKKKLMTDWIYLNGLTFS